MLCLLPSSPLHQDSIVGFNIYYLIEAFDSHEHLEVCTKETGQKNNENCASLEFRLPSFQFELR